MNPIELYGDLTELHDAWSDIHDSGRFSEGYYVETFEDEATELMGGYHVAFNSAGTALFSVMRRYSPGTWIVPSNTFFATGAMVKEAGHTVKLADCSREDFSLDMPSLLKAYTGKEMGVVLTHVGGGIAKDYAKIAEFCEAHDLILIEDAAHAFGAKDRMDNAAGDLGDAAVYSFYPTKAVPVGEGGLVTTCNPELAVFLREFRNYGKSKDRKGVIHYAQGFNFRMDEWTAAVAVHQIRRLSQILELRHRDIGRLSALFPRLVSWEGLENGYKFIISKAVAEQEGLKRLTGQVYSTTDQLVKALNYPIPVELPNCDWVADHHVCLPVGVGMYQGMSDDQIIKYLRSVP
jgi:dTDP-4-amino-4,6-dideoxygalactose transaminase